jgi:prepilin-type N-terminal cleavage/methylation domain-containing protein
MRSKSEIRSTKSETNPKHQIEKRTRAPVWVLRAWSLFRISCFGFRASRRSGFTLVEVLLALALSGILIAAVVSSLDLYRRLSSAGQRDVARARLARALFDRVNDDVRSVAFLPPEEEASTSSGDEQAAAEEGATEEPAEEEVEIVVDPDAEFVSGSVGLAGDMFTLVLHTNQPDRSEATALFTLDELLQIGGRTSDQRSVTYFVAQQGMPGLQGVVAERLIAAMPLEDQRLLDASQPLGLVRLDGDRLSISLADDTGNLDALAEGAQLLAPEVRTLTFQYYDGTLWWPEWDSVAYGRLPRAIEVTLGIRIDDDRPEEEGGLRDVTLDEPVANVVLHRFVINLPQSEQTPLEAF